MNGPNQLITSASQYFAYRAEGFLDQSEASVIGVESTGNVLVNLGPVTIAISAAAARELAAHLTAAADCIDSQQGGEA